MAIKQYDSNGDGLISGSELEKAPALKAALTNLDKNSDGSVSQDEVSERIKSWMDSRVGITNARCSVQLNGQPLQGGTITFEPEEFLGDSIKTAVGQISADGSASPSIPKDQRPVANIPGLALGLYKVRISYIQNGKETIPEKYNTNTILGQEVAMDDPQMMKNRIVFRLEK